MGAESGSDSYDVLIAGGGLVGASLACALGNQALRVGVIEARPLKSDLQPSFDARSVALAWGSRRVFEAMDLWADMAALGVAPIEHIHVSDRGRPGVAHLDCAQQGVEAFGYVLENRVLGQVLGAALPRYDNIDFICPATLAEFDGAGGAAVKVAINHDGEPRELSTRLLVAADGGDSMVRTLADIGTVNIDYGQSAIIANVVSARPHRNTAYERFTGSGPLAVLPACDHGSAQEAGRRCALVWTVRNSQCDEVLALDDAAFINRLQQRFGDRLGGFTRVGERHAYPLSLRHAREHVRPRLAVVGNAAHTLHPVAGQGFNLGLRDVAVLAQVVSDAVRAGQDPGSLQVLKQYANWRRRDHLQVSAFTDGLVRVFSNDSLPLAVARNLGLLALDIVPPLKGLLARHAMGFVGKLPRLARGLPL
ncbi:MAG: 2-octaprenyl-6-methoxyphenyl hydroxylase [Pseudomonadota bacterium]|nr:MAG: 2-octaprenyl-6-methoxyphenyl hydroxylase [Pseudomonadota bacterium]